MFFYTHNTTENFFVTEQEITTETSVIGILINPVSNEIEADVPLPVNTLSAEYTDPYISFREVSRGLLQSQCQYASRYTGGGITPNGVLDSMSKVGYADLGTNLRFKGTRNNYHSLKIHIDDISEFINRYCNEVGRTKIPSTNEILLNIAKIYLYAI